MTDLNIMKEYRDARKEGEAYLQSKHLVCTIIRPWYVIGPGHLWPLTLLPFYAVGKFIPSMQKKVEQTAFISIRQMLHTLMKAIDSPPQKLRVFEIKHIKKDSLPTI